MKNQTFLALALLSTFAQAQNPTEPIAESSPTNRALEITVFGDETPAQLSDARKITLPNGNARLRVFGLPETGLIANSLQFDAAPPVKILALRGAASPSAFSLADFVGETVGLQQNNAGVLKIVQGKLLSAGSPVLLETSDGVLLNPPGTWVLPRGNARLAPQKSEGATEWSVNSAGGEFGANFRSQISGLKYGIRYVATLKGATLDLTGYAVLNASSDAARATRGGNFSLFEKRPPTLVAGYDEVLSFANLNLENGENLRAFVSTSLPVQNALRFESNARGAGLTQTYDYRPAQRSLTFARTVENGLLVKNSVESTFLRGRPAGTLTLWRPEASAPERVVRQENWTPSNEAISLGADFSRRVARNVLSNKLLNPTTRELTIELRISANYVTDPVNGNFPAMTLVEFLPSDTKVLKSSLKPTKNDAESLVWELPKGTGDTSITYSVQTPA